MTRDQIRTIFLTHGFTIKDGEPDLKPYVYDAAQALIDMVRNEAAEPAYYVLNNLLYRYRETAEADSRVYGGEIFPLYAAPPPLPRLSRSEREVEQLRGECQGLNIECRTLRRDLRLSECHVAELEVRAARFQFIRSVMDAHVIGRVVAKVRHGLSQLAHALRRNTHK